MTSTTDTDGHPEVAEISALVEGILPPERSVFLRDHLAGCALCMDIRQALDEIRTLLGTLPGPTRMPEEIAGRIDAALAAEALISATPRHEAPLVVTPRSAPAAAAADVSRETPHGTRRPAGHTSAPAGPGRTRRRRWAHVLLAACSAAILAGGAIVVLHSVTSNGAPPPQVNGTVGYADAFSGVELPVRVHQLLASASPKAGAQSTAGNPMHLDIATVPACVLQGTGHAEEPIASIKGRYDGHNAYLIVLPHLSDSAQVDAYVVDASCDSAASPARGHLLAQHTYNRD